MKNKSNFIFPVIVCLFLLLGESVSTNQDAEQRLSKVLVHTQNGPVQGIIKRSRNPSIEFVSYVGLRYSNPPARFEEAQPLEKTWSTPKVVNIPGNNCPQIGEAGNWDENEDCLFLNVYVPKSHLEEKSASKKLPVMVWIHGGGFSFGDGYNYGAEYFMETEEVILVTINYRLGMFGFITMETDTAFTSNNGLRDSVQALKWVQENIEAFKGDSNKVTIAGNSAGSVMIHYLLMSPLAKGLFHGAIMQSAAFSLWSYAPNPRKDVVQIAKHLGCSNSEEPMEVRKCLETKSVKELLLAQFTFAPRWPQNSPVGRFVPTAKEPQNNAFFSGKPSSFFTFHGEPTQYVNKVPVIAGIVKDEGSTLFTAFILSDKKLFKELDEGWDTITPYSIGIEGHFPTASLPGITKRLREHYFGKASLTEEVVNSLSSFYSDSIFILPVMHAAGDMAKSGMKVWPYVITYLSDWSMRKALNMEEVPGTIGHGDELQYFFPHPLLGPPLKQDATNFSKRLVKLWTSFVKNGEPATEWQEGESLNWKPIEVSNENGLLSEFDVLSIDSSPKVNTFDFHVQHKLWRETFKRAAAGVGEKSEGESHKSEL